MIHIGKHGDQNVLLMNKVITTDKLKEYEFEKCNRCLFEKTPDELGETKKQAYGTIEYKSV